MVGNKKVRERLWRIAAEDRLAHAYLFAGPEEVGKKTTALAFARRILCEKREACATCPSCLSWKAGHPDFLFIAPEGEGLRRNIGINQARSARRFLELTGQLGERKVVVIDEADRLGGEATNSLLKALEEPSPRMVIILVTAIPWALLATVRSRCVSVRFSPVSNAQILSWLSASGVSVDEAAELTRLSGGRPGRVHEFINDAKAKKDFVATVRLFQDVIGESAFQKHKIFSSFIKNRDLLARSRTVWLEEAHRKMPHLPAKVTFFVAALLQLDPYAPYDPVLSLLSQSTS